MRIGKRQFGVGLLAALLVGSQSAYAAESDPVNAKPKVEAGYYYSLQVEEDGTVWSFGKRPGDIHSSQVGRLKGGTLDEIVQVSAGYAHAAAIDADGHVWTWGSNERGQLGFGDEEKYDAAGQVSFDSNDRIEAVAAGYDHTLALSASGKVWAWGSNRYGQLGDGSESDRSKPVRVMDGRKPLDDIIAVSAGFGLSLALNEDGEVWTWGSQGKANGELQQVMIQKGEKLVPLEDIVAISSGYDHALALDKSGNLYGWGSNRDGQLGVGKGTTYSLHAIDITGLPAIKSISAGDRTSAAIDKSGDIWIWGIGYPNDYRSKPGENDRFEPERITEGEHFTALSVGRDHGIAIDDEENIWVWGENDYYQLGHAYNSFSTTKPVVKKALQRSYVSASMSSVTIEEAVVEKERAMKLKLNLQLKDTGGSPLYGKWPTAELKLTGLGPIVEPFKRSTDGGYTTEITIPFPYYFVHPQIEIVVDGQTIATVTDEKNEP